MRTITRILLSLMTAGALWTGAALAQSTAQPGTTQSPDANKPSATQPQATQPATSDAQNQQATTEQGPVLIDPGLIYNDKTPTRWVNKQVTLKNVTVQDTNDDGNFWVGSDSGHRLLIVKSTDPALSAMKLHKGDIVTISGTVKAAGEYASVGDRGSMNDAKNSSGVFLQANKVEIASSTQH